MFDLKPAAERCKRLPGKELSRLNLKQKVTIQVQIREICYSCWPRVGCHSIDRTAKNRCPSRGKRLFFRPAGHKTAYFSLYR
ncbi:MAG: hypothetical protein DRH04_07155 [Deltaproteobacteria bacterium]|nr:MAG: hypothetical protein DRH04_07155 [Deltaproteobacteria bacterium]